MAAVAKILEQVKKTIELISYNSLAMQYFLRLLIIEYRKTWKSLP